MLLAAITVYIALTLGVGAYTARFVKRSKDFVLAGRQLPVFLSSAALFATWFGSETIFGASSEYLEHGLQGVIEDPFGGALCLILFGLFYLRPMYKMDVLTIGAVYKKLFGPRIELLASLFMIPAYFGYVAAQLVAMALIFSSITDFTLAEGVLIGAVIVVVYTYMGGMWAISITDFIQTSLIIIGLAWVAYTVAADAGGVGVILDSAPEGSFQVLPDSNPVSWLNYLGAWMILGLGSIPSQDIYQRVMSSKSERVAFQSTLIAGSMYLTLGLLPLFIALGAKYLYPELYLEDKQFLLPSMVLNHSSLFVQILFFGALLSAIMSTTSSGLLAPAAVIGENIIRPIWGKNWSDRRFLWALRLSIVGVAIVAIALALYKANIYELVADASILLLVSLFVPLTAGLYWKGARERGAYWSIIGGMIAYLILLQVPLPIYAHIPALGVSILGMLIGSWTAPKQTES
ncbi:sodium/solute symporter family protein [Nitritalea halalkaliphila LW7]|uniref:Sodium/solute symporter family protein n=1 Tax=Nitritalea halalkaliphila LW7 TaxID=1189621 RepID=I5C883_9BACT|nr:sodium:solute symporter family protein [Nitritalea halalkaliphila]EIM78035.1 sodium/solute symporter family protein [Nitritalea halalkaliphila LW7]